MKTSFLSLVALLACVAGSAAAQPVKKYVTPEGKVIYSDQPVPGAREAGEVAPPTPVSPEDKEAARKAAERDASAVQELEKGASERRSGPASIADLEANLKLARKQLAEGEEPLPGERTGTAGGGSRLNDRYWARQKANREAVTKAQKELDDARAGK
jgi:Domain of unknown function (DUF4124)